MKYELYGIKATHLFKHKDKTTKFTLAWHYKTKKHFVIDRDGNAFGLWSSGTNTEEELNSYGWIGERINVQLENK